jgi:hypothetical protein
VCPDLSSLRVSAPSASSSVKPLHREDSDPGQLPNRHKGSESGTEGPPTPVLLCLTASVSRNGLDAFLTSSWKPTALWASVTKCPLRTGWGQGSRGLDDVAPPWAAVRRTHTQNLPDGRAARSGGLADPPRPAPPRLLVTSIG